MYDIDVTFYYHGALIVPLIAIVGFVIVKSIVEIIPL